MRLLSREGSGRRVISFGASGNRHDRESGVASGCGTKCQSAVQELALDNTSATDLFRRAGRRLAAIGIFWRVACYIGQMEFSSKIHERDA